MAPQDISNKRPATPPPYNGPADEKRGLGMKMLSVFPSVKELVQSQDTLKQEIKRLGEALAESETEKDALASELYAARAAAEQDKLEISKLCDEKKSLDLLVTKKHLAIEELNTQIVEVKNKLIFAQEALANANRGASQTHSEFNGQITQLKNINDDLERRMAECENEKARLKNDLNAKASEVELLSCKLADAEQEAKRLQTALDEYKAVNPEAVKIADIETQLATAEQEKQRAQQELDEARNRSEALFDHHAAMLKSLLTDAQADLSSAYPTGRADAIGKMLESILNDNAMMSLAEFAGELFLPAFDNAEKSEHALNDKLSEAYRKLLRPQRPTWLDSLMRLDAMVSVGFIAQQYMDKGLDVSAVHRTAANVRRLLAAQGITLVVPRLFVDIFDPARHDAQPIKDISQQVEDVASHVPSEETIIDIFTIGYHSDDHELSRRPAVSRLNA